MLIRYTGPKPVKKVEVAGKWYTFEPACEFNEVFDLPVIEWLLHPDRKGLFVVDKETLPDKTPSHLHGEITSPPKAKERPKQKKGRSKKDR